jgi:putative endonuclease
VSTNQTTGRAGEDLAADYLVSLGYRILERNYRFEGAEVDIVCFEPATEYERGGELVFVEVKTRRGTSFGPPEEAISEAKKRSLIKGAEAYLHERRLDGSPCRFDVIGILHSGNSEPEITHLKDAFWTFGSFGS